MMFVFSSPSEGQEDEYNEWYSNVHLNEVLRTDGFVAAQRFRLATGEEPSKAPAPYLAVYEVEGDWQSAYEALTADRVNRTPVPSAFGPGVVSFWFTPVTDRVTGESEIAERVRGTVDSGAA